MVQLQYLMRNQVLNRKRKLFGDKQQNITFQELYLLIRWMLLVLILKWQPIRFVKDWVRKLHQFNYQLDRKSTRVNSSHVRISYAVFCLKKKKKTYNNQFSNTTTKIIKFNILIHTYFNYKPYFFPLATIFFC